MQVRSWSSLDLNRVSARKKNTIGFETSRLASADILPLARHPTSLSKYAPQEDL
jgi:hypothetical protein